MIRYVTRKIQECRRRYRQAREQVRRHWRKGAGIALVLFILTKKDVDIALDLNGPALPDLSFPSPATVLESISSFFSSGEGGTYHPGQYIFPQNTSMLDKERAEQPLLTGNRFSPAGGEANLANTFSNLIFSEGPFRTSESERERAEKRRKQEKYVARFSPVARGQMEEFGIPASIILAQGLLESNAGESSLAVKNNNHFGIKCFSRSCRKGHCSNFTDDHHKDFFRIYQTPADSYRAHSLLLRSKRYRRLFKLDPTDYQGWAYGLKEAGYATDKFYAEKIISMIEDLRLDRYDRR